MSYHLYIKINDSSLKKYYEKAVEEFNSKVNDTYCDSGFDLFVCDAFDTNSFTENSPLKIDHKVSCAMYKDKDISCEAEILTGSKVSKLPSAYYLYPRSSISKTPFRLANSVGIIDSGYRGNLIAKVDKVYNNQCVVNSGERLFQICAPNLSPLKSVTIVDELDDTARSSGGFGSTGK